MIRSRISRAWSLRWHVSGEVAGVVESPTLKHSQRGTRPLQTGNLGQRIHDCPLWSLAVYVVRSHTESKNRGTLPIPPLSAGLLPLGRHPATLLEIEADFVKSPDFATSTTRQEIWSHYIQAFGTLDQVVPVLAAWIGGSFTTDKTDPDDIDVLWIVDGRRYPVLTPPEQAVVAIFSQGKVLRERTQARVDTYVLPWEPIPVPDLQANAHDLGLAAYRGYWDDLWLRKIQGSKLLPRTIADALPRRGYLEVTFRDYL